MNLKAIIIFLFASLALSFGQGYKLTNVTTNDPGVGTNGQVLTVTNSAGKTGWRTPSASASGNYIPNTNGDGYGYIRLNDILGLDYTDIWQGGREFSLSNSLGRKWLKYDSSTGMLTLRPETAILLPDLTADMVLYVNGAGAVTASSVTSTELGYVSGGTSSFQTQLNAKASTAALTATNVILLARANQVGADGTNNVNAAGTASTNFARATIGSALTNKADAIGLAGTQNVAAVSTIVTANTTTINQNSNDWVNLKALPPNIQAGVGVQLSTNQNTNVVATMAIDAGSSVTLTTNIVNGVQRVTIASIGSTSGDYNAAEQFYLGTNTLMEDFSSPFWQYITPGSSFNTDVVKTNENWLLNPLSTASGSFAFKGIGVEAPVGATQAIFSVEVMGLKTTDTTIAIGFIALDGGAGPVVTFSITSNAWTTCQVTNNSITPNKRYWALIYTRNSSISLTQKSAFVRNPNLFYNVTIAPSRWVDVPKNYLARNHVTSTNYPLHGSAITFSTSSSNAVFELSANMTNAGYKYISILTNGIPFQTVTMTNSFLIWTSSFPSAIRRLVTVVNGPQVLDASHVVPYGIWVRRISTSDPYITFEKPRPRTDVLVVGDSMESGIMVSNYFNTMTAVAERQTGLEIETYAIGSLGLTNLSANNYQVVRDHIRRAQPSILWVPIGFNDPFIYGMTTNAFTLTLSNLLYWVQNDFPDLQVYVQPIIAKTPSNNANGSGETFQQFRAAQTNAVSYFPRVKILDASLFTPTSTEFDPDNIHPNNAGGLRIGIQMATALLTPGSPSFTYTPPWGGVTNTLTGSATLDFAAGSVGAEQDLSITVTGAADGDAVELGVLNTCMGTGAKYQAWVGGANTVYIRYWVTSGTFDPPSAVFKVIVKKF